jgi:hypothetical protein
MNKRDTIRVFRYDEEIAELEQQLALQLDIESMQDKTMFPVSKGLEYKLSRIRGARARFIKICGHTANKRIRYDMITAEKRAAIARAELEYKQELTRYAILMASSVTPEDALGIENLNIQRRLCSKKKRAIAARHAALSRWLLITPNSIAAPIPTRADEDYILDSRHMPEAELILERTNSERERDYAEEQESQPAPALSAEQEIIARAARAQLERSQSGITNTSSARVDISAQQPDTYSASFALLNHQPVAEEEEN